MKKFFVLFSGLLVMSPIFLSLNIGAEEKPAAASTVTNPNQKVFEAKCTMCHGKDGKGQPSMAKMFKLELSQIDLTGKSIAQMKDADLSALITNGKNKMPAYGKQLKPQDITGLIAYIRTLAGKPIVK